ncbi:MAG: substrate-binding domain-containing protein [Streptosporangiales bacterium]|nr:substrate-binding domain-containing protein [Streptosporangiales bacterium]
MSSRPTMSDVARAAGVHKATASRALNPDTSGLVNAATARRVLLAARELGYTPNTMARGLRTSRSHTVGVLIPDLTNPLFPPIVRGIETALSARDYTALIANTDNDDAQETSRFEALLGRHVDGLILATGRREHPLLQAAHERGVRAVLVNRGTERPLYPVVTGDDAAGIAAAVDHLADLGHRRLLHLAGPAALSTGASRARAFRQAVTARQVDGTVVACSSYSIRAGEDAMRGALEHGAAPTGVVAGNDLIALGALRAVRAHGLRCPADVSVVGYNDMPFLDEVDPPLTSIHVPHHELGAEAARLLLQQLDGTPGPPKTITLPVHLVIRASTAPPGPA